MCIVLLTTAHPSYALIVIDNRDEFILRPTSRPHWWSHPSGASVLSARDLQREEKGTWLGITKTGQLAVLTNYRETDPEDAGHPIHAARSRGGMVTAWLGSDPAESASDSVNHLVKDGGVKGVGGFSMVAGKLKRKRGSDEKPEHALEGVAIVSNRCDNLHDVPWVAEERDEVYGLSNTVYDDPKPWPKVESGKRLVREAIQEAVAQDLDEEALAERLFTVLDTDTLPKHPDMSLADYIKELKQSIFIPALGDESHRKAMEEAVARGQGRWADDDQKAAESLQLGERPDPPAQGSNNVGFEVGLYGTQRQTVIMVDWDGNVSYRERALWDGNGNPIARGQGDEVFRFKIEGWEN
ncbi:Transport and Golgi organization protein 2-like protein [Colletotrichum chlorophyti]|uniref:Transport and Golgi organization protein 2-like protein n=1 Tax=Colletotrichum chlorophyti TaxID=708187 RepID=A0A1Q8RE07_9PEZI|nr:Transport and Golgi organization protein 2-like protein [Colletotrichum chlorophyti]